MFSPTESHVGPERAVHGLGQPIYRWWTPASKSLASTYPGPVVAGGNTGCWSPLSCNWLFTESLVCQLLCSALDSASQEPGREGLFSFCKQGQWAGEVCSTRSRLVGAELRCKPGPSGPSLSATSPDAFFHPFPRVHLLLSIPGYFTTTTPFFFPICIIPSFFLNDSSLCPEYYLELQIILWLLITLNVSIWKDLPVLSCMFEFHLRFAFLALAFVKVCPGYVRMASPPWDWGPASEVEPPGAAVRHTWVRSVTREEGFPGPLVFQVTCKFSQNLFPWCYMIIRSVVNNLKS